MKSELMPHTKTHSKNKHFQCKYYDKAFSENSDIIDHIRVHTEEKPYYRNQYMTFSQYSNLICHIRKTNWG